MKNLLSLTLFTIFILILNASISCTKSQLKTKAMSKLKLMTNTLLENQAKNYNSYKAMSQQGGLSEMQKEWAKMFSGERGSTCIASSVSPDISSKPEDNSSGLASGWGVPRPGFKWLKKWGFGPVAYLIDFLDPVIKADFLVECKNIIEGFKTIPNKDTEDYADQFKLSLIAKPDNKLESDKDFKNLNPAFSKDSWDVGVNTVQLFKAIGEWGWYINEGATDPAFEHLLKYDIDGDGRLNTSELFLSIIHSNRKREGLFCFNCFHLLAKKLGAMFMYLDCKNQGYLTAEDLWVKLPKLVRGTTKWNIFARGNLDTIRTNTVNDFILKNGYSIDGGITKDEFVNGILFALWQRNITNTKVLEAKDESRSMKSHRWINDVIDKLEDEYVKDNTPKA